MSHDLRVAAEQRGAHTALVTGCERLSYAEFDRRASWMAAGLHAVGVRRGDRVALLMKNSAQAAVAIYGIARAGAAFVVLNAATKEDQLAQLLSHCGAVAALCDEETAGRVRATQSRTPALRELLVVDDAGRGLAAYDEPERSHADLREEVLEVDLAAIIYTSGSTGVPKGAVFLHRNVHVVAGSIIRYLGLAADDRILSVLPLSHTYGLYQLILSVRAGATLVLQHGMAFPGTMVAALADEGITVLPGVPTMWHVLVTMSGLAERDHPNLRVLTNAGAALSASRVADVRRTFPTATFFSMYGQTECKRISYLPPAELDRRPGSVGLAIPGTEVWLEDQNGQPVRPGEVGQLIVRGDHVMQGYWDDPEATARKLRPGRFPGDRVLHSDDLFRQDLDGYLYFVGRRDDIIKSRGEKVAPREIEEVLSTRPEVQEVAVVGFPDELLGEAVVAHVSICAGSNLDQTALRRYCAEHLEDFKVPKYVVFHDELPKTHNGKIDKRLLSEHNAVRPGAG